MADDYTPSEARVCIDYCNAAVARREADPVIGMAEADAEFDRFIEAVKRDAAQAERKHIVSEVYLWGRVNEDLGYTESAETLTRAAGDIERIPEETP